MFQSKKNGGMADSKVFSIQDKLFFKIKYPVTIHAREIH